MVLKSLFTKSQKELLILEIKEEIIKKLIFPFHKFDISTLEYKPFTRFTIAKNLDETTSGKLSKLINSIIKDRDSGCFYY